MANIDRTFREYHITKNEQHKIMDVMDKYRNLIDDGIKVSSASFENDIISIFGGDINAARHNPSIEYHFCEFIAKDFMEDGRWEEVYPALYGDLPKYGGKLNK